MEDFIPIFAIFAVFGSVVAIVVGPQYLKSKERQEVQATVRAAIDKGQPLPPEVIDAMGKEVVRNVPSRTRDLRRGIIWLAVGIGLAAFGLVNDLGWGNGGDDWNSAGDRIGGGLLGIACIPATIGIAFIILSFFNKNKD